MPAPSSLALPLALALGALIAPTPPDDPPAGDLAKLQGTWVGMGGPNNSVKLTIRIDRKAVSVRVPIPDVDRDVEIKGELSIDEKPTPRTIDWVHFKTAGEDADDLPETRSIYELNGDEFRVCSGAPGTPRPTEFKAGAGGQPPYLTVYRRQK